MTVGGSASTILKINGCNLFYIFNFKDFGVSARRFCDVKVDVVRTLGSVWVWKCLKGFLIGEDVGLVYSKI